MPAILIVRIIVGSIIGAIIGFFIGKILVGIDKAIWKWRMRRQFRKLNNA